MGHRSSFSTTLSSADRWKSRRAGVGLIAALAVAGTIYPAIATAQDLERIAREFVRPPQPARVRAYWWWLNGNTDAATITSDLQEMAAKGFGGAMIVDAGGASQNGNDPVPAGPLFGSPRWRALYLHALKEADRLGLEISLNIVSGWNLGGPAVTPERASKILTWSRTAVEGGRPVRIDLDVSPNRKGYFRDIAVLAYPLHHGRRISQRMGGDDSYGISARTAAIEAGYNMPDTTGMLVPTREPADTRLNEVQDVSAFFSNGTLAWSPPAGEWEILRIGYTVTDARVSTSSGAWKGMVIDYLDHAQLDWYWDETVKPMLEEARPYLGRSLKYLATDSWELGGTNWTPAFREQFRRLRGYDPLPYLPIVAGRVIGDGETSARFLADLRRTVADLVTTEHYDHLAALAKAYGLATHPESGGPHGAPIDALETFRSSAFPQTEFWAPSPHRPTDQGRFFTKQGASAANIYGLPFNAQEGPTSVGPHWSLGLASDLKPAIDRALTEGMTRLFWHEFTSSPAATGLPGQEYFAGEHINPKVTWWRDGKPFFDYIARSMYLLSQGRAVNDALYFYGDNIPVFARLKADDPAHVLPGYDYDVTNLDALMRTIDMSGGALHGPKGIGWQLLVLPPSGRFPLSLLERIEAYVREGGAVAGERPSGPTGIAAPSEQRRFDALTARLWRGCGPGGSVRYGKGVVHCNGDGAAALGALGVLPDFVAPPGSGLDYIHRRTADADIYFVRNGTAQPVIGDARFRAVSDDVQLWDPLTGVIEKGLATAPAGRNTTSVRLDLPAFGTAFILFPHGRPSAVAAQAEPSAMPAAELPIDRGWTVRFDPARGGPAGSIATGLGDWTASDDPRIRYYSGTATYRAAFEIPAIMTGRMLTLRFASVREIGRVRINGKEAGTVWARPYTLRVDGLIRPGRNEIEVDVSNLWINRLIGDLQPGATPVTKTNIRNIRPDQPLARSGIIGGVRIEAR